jgi:hypothetical protein
MIDSLKYSNDVMLYKHLLNPKSKLFEQKPTFFNHHSFFFYAHLTFFKEKYSSHPPRDSVSGFPRQGPGAFSLPQRQRDAWLGEKLLVHGMPPEALRGCQHRRWHGAWLNWGTWHLPCCGKNREQN